SSPLFGGYRPPLQQAQSPPSVHREELFSAAGARQLPSFLSSFAFSASHGKIPRVIQDFWRAVETTRQTIQAQGAASGRGPKYRSDDGASGAGIQGNAPAKKQESQVDLLAREID